MCHKPILVNILLKLIEYITWIEQVKIIKNI